MGESPAVSKEDFEAAMATEQGRIDALTNSLQGEREQRIRLEERLKQPAPKPSEPAKIFTRAELDQMVDKGEISESSRDQVLSDQQDQRVEAMVAARVDERVLTVTKSDRVSTQLGEYIEKMPDLKDEQSENRKRVDAAFQFHVSLNGPPKDEAESRVYELLACHATFGAIGGVQETTRTETHQETGGDGGGDSKNENGGDGAPQGTPANLIPYYEDQFKKGRYTGWTDPKVVKELGYVKAS
ncbi:MAG: hypothetical protein V3R58_08515 [candidate division NC10 bacterium]